jgi:ATP-dependent protease ClpP protease subunit
MTHPSREGQAVQKQTTKSAATEENNMNLKVDRILREDRGKFQTDIPIQRESGSERPGLLPWQQRSTSAEHELLLPAALPAQTVYFSFSAEINSATTEAFLSNVTRQVNQGVRSIYLLLSTPAGTVTHALTLFNVLRGLPIQLITHNVGTISSAGNAVFLAGNPRYACPHSAFTYNGIGFNANQGGTFEEKSARDKIRVFAEQKRIGAIIEERTRLTKYEIESMLREGQPKDPAFALGYGIIDDIRDVKVPAGVPVIQFAMQGNHTL